MSKYEEVEAAKATLTKHGYQVANLWSIEDAQHIFPDCTDDQAHDLIHDALTNEATMSQIWFAIALIGEDFYDLKKNED